MQHSHSSSNMVTLLAAEIQTRKSQPGMLEPYSHIKCTNLRKLVFNTMYTSKILLEETKQNKKPLLPMPETFKRGTSHSGQSIASAMQNKSTSIRHVGIYYLPFPVWCAFRQLLLKFDCRKLVTYLSREENVFTSLEKIENAESSN